MNKNTTNDSLPVVGEQELRSLSNMIFHQEEKDCVVGKEVIPMKHEGV